MPALTIPNVFTFQQDPIPSDGVNVNFAAVAAIVNNLDEDNVNPASEIAIKNAVSNITAVWSFLVNPVFAAGAILDAYLTANVPLKDAANIFAGINTFDQAIAKFQPPILGAHPTTAAENNYEYIYSGDNLRYRYIHPTGPVQMDYVGGYTGGALRPYSGSIVVDENTPAEVMFKVDAGFTTVKIALIGTGFPSYIYTELPEHLHAVGTLLLTSGAVTGLNHKHDVVLDHAHPGTQFASVTHIHKAGKHTHGVGSFTINNVPGHDHGGDTDSTNTSDIGPPLTGHTHPIDTQPLVNMNLSGNSLNEGDVNTDQLTAGGEASVSGWADTVESADPAVGWTPVVATAISGSTANAGILGNTLNDTIKLNITDAIKLYITQDRAVYGSGYDKVTYPALANILNANGTGEIDITLKCAIGFNYIKIIDETVKKGGTILYHIEIV